MLSRDQFIGRVKQGFHYCVGCGDPTVPPEESWKTMDSMCFAAKKPTAYCRDCGGMLEEKRIAWAKKKGFPCTHCFYCSKKMTQPHPVYGVKLPERFFATLTSISKS